MFVVKIFYDGKCCYYSYGPLLFTAFPKIYSYSLILDCKVTILVVDKLFLYLNRDCPRQMLLLPTWILKVLFLLLQCECEDEFCVEAKSRIDICRPQVLRGAENATSSCTLSQLICIANAQCAAALSFYHQYCRSMFRGRKCSNKCLNSIEILRKQEKAAALTVCQCDGNEDYNCPQMQSNLERLCFHKKGHGRGHERGHEKPKKVPKDQVIHDAASTTVVSGLLLMCAVLLTFNTWWLMNNEAFNRSLAYVKTILLM